MSRCTPLSIRGRARLGSGCVLFLIALAGCQPEAADDASATPPAEAAMATEAAVPHVVAPSPIEAGRYLIIVGGCNDCHTDGYMQGPVPEEAWLTGSAMGWRGPWGTTYPANLRLRVQEMTEDEWVEQLHTRTTNPPMPWVNVNQMSDMDARAIYRYIQSLGPAGEHAPMHVPPGEEPATPFLDLQPRNLPTENPG